MRFSVVAVVTAVFSLLVAAVFSVVVAVVAAVFSLVAVVAAVFSVVVAAVFSVVATAVFSTSLTPLLRVTRGENFFGGMVRILLEYYLWVTQAAGWCWTVILSTDIA